MHRFRILAPLLTMLTLVLLLLPATAAQARIVKVEGLRVNVPAGYRLTWNAGSYTLSNRQRFVKVTYGRSPLALKPTANQVARGMKGRLTGVKAARNGKSLTGTITRVKKVRGKRLTYVYQLRLTRAGMKTTVQLYGSKQSRRVSRSTLGRATDIFGPIVTAQDILFLNRILQTRRGTPRVIPFNLAIPTRVFQAPVQNGASAVVPNLPGWNYRGTDTGYLTGGHPTQGAFELGGFLLVNFPGFQQPGAPVATPNGDPVAGPAQAMSEVLPQYWRNGSGAAATFTAIQPVQGTAGLLGNGYVSHMYEAAFTLNGTPWVGIFTIGMSDVGLPGMAWGFYFSYLAVPVNGPGGVMQALLNVGATWNNDAAVQSGLAKALATVATTRVPGAPIDPAVFAKTHEMWTDYIRG